jgi:hypothetical protein
MEGGVSADRTGLCENRRAVAHVVLKHQLGRAIARQTIRQLVDVRIDRVDLEGTEVRQLELVVAGHLGDGHTPPSWAILDPTDR